MNAHPAIASASAHRRLDHRHWDNGGYSNGEDEGELCTCEDDGEGRLLQVDNNYTLNVTVDGGEASASFIVNYGESVLLAGFVSEIDGSSSNGTFDWAPSGCGVCGISDPDVTDNTTWTAGTSADGTQNIELGSGQRVEVCGTLQNIDWTVKVTATID